MFSLMISFSTSSARKSRFIRIRGNAFAAPHQTNRRSTQFKRYPALPREMGTSSSENDPSRTTVTNPPHKTVLQEKY